MRHGHLQEFMVGCNDCEMDTKAFKLLAEKYETLTEKYGDLADRYVLLSDELCKLKLDVSRGL